PSPTSTSPMDQAAPRAGPAISVGSFRKNVPLLARPLGHSARGGARPKTDDTGTGTGSVAVGVTRMPRDTTGRDDHTRAGWVAPRSPVIKSTTSSKSALS